MDVVERPSGAVADLNVPIWWLITSRPSAWVVDQLLRWGYDELVELVARLDDDIKGYSDDALAAALRAAAQKRQALSAPGRSADGRSDTQMMIDLAKAQHKSFTQVMEERRGQELAAFEASLIGIDAHELLELIARLEKDRSAQAKAHLEVARRVQALQAAASTLRPGDYITGLRDQVQAFSRRRAELAGVGDEIVDALPTWMVPNSKLAERAVAKKDAADLAELEKEYKQRLTILTEQANQAQLTALTLLLNFVVGPTADRMTKLDARALRILDQYLTELIVRGQDFFDMSRSEALRARVRREEVARTAMQVVAKYNIAFCYQKLHEMRGIIEENIQSAKNTEPYTVTKWLQSWGVIAEPEGVAELRAGIAEMIRQAQKEYARYQEMIAICESAEYRGRYSGAIRIYNFMRRQLVEKMNRDARDQG